MDARRRFRQGGGNAHCCPSTELTLDHPPGVLPAAHLLAAHLQHGVGAHHGEGNARLQLAVLGLELLVLVRVAVWELVDLGK